MNSNMIIGIVLIATGIILMALFGAWGNYYIQKGRTEKGKEQTKEINTKQDSVKTEILDSINSKSAASLKEASKIQDAQLDISDKIDNSTNEIIKGQEKNRKAISNIDLPTAISEKKVEEMIKVSEFFQSNLTDTDWFHFFDFFEIIKHNGAIVKNDYRKAFFGSKPTHNPFDGGPFESGYSTYNYCTPRKNRTRTKIEWGNYEYCEIFTTSKFPSALKKLTEMENSVLLDEDIILLIKSFKKLAGDNIWIIRANLIRYAKTDLKQNKTDVLNYVLGAHSGYKKLNKFNKQKDLILSKIKNKLNE